MKMTTPINPNPSLGRTLYELPPGHQRARRAQIDQLFEGQAPYNINDVQNFLDKYDDLNQMNQPREIKIRPVLNGFIVQVGCQTVVFDNISAMTSAIERYYKDPGAVEKEFVARALNRTAETDLDYALLAPGQPQCETERPRSVTDPLRVEPERPKQVNPMARR